jgi:gliding motility-associated lipoprotein GldD
LESVAQEEGERAERKGGQVAEVCWFNLAYPQWKARLHFTYMPVRGNLDKLMQEAHDMTFSHEIKSSGIGKRRYSFPERGVYGLMFELDGPVATPLQILATDSSNHFLRGALYFEHVPNPDSIAPAYDRIAKDVVHLIETLEWKP